MDIALVRQRYNPFGGAERFIERALGALGGEGVRVTIFARSWKPVQGVDFVRCDPFHIGRTWRDTSFEAEVCRQLAQRRFDLVQSHERIACCDLYRAGDGVHRQWLENRDRARGGLRRAFTGLSPYHARVLRAEKRMFESARLRAVVCNSRMVAAEVRRWFGLPEERLHVVHNGVDLERFNPALREAGGALRATLGVAEAGCLLVMVGSGFERKGVPQLLQAMQSLGRRDLHLAVVGADRRLAAFKADAASRGLGAQVHFTGGVEDVRPWYGAADCFVLPTLYDPFPNAALEALACGLPVVTSTACGAAELVTEGANGHVCDSMDVAALSRLLDRGRGDWEAMRGAARAAVSGLSPAGMAARLADVYRGLLGAVRH
jgi:UDP-glucose:(heptosyl)LPS alpha-1,3-glucosyltransferase